MYHVFSVLTKFVRVALPALIGVVAAHAQLFTGLGPFPVVDPKFVPSIRVAGVSNNGIVVGTGYVGTFNSAFSWSQGSGFELLPSLSGGTRSWGNGVSDDGKIVIGASTSTTGVQATKWASGAPQGLGSLPGYGSNATAISGDGTAIWGTSTTSYSDVAVGPGWRINSGAAMVSLGSEVATPFDASGDGAVVVGSQMLIPASGTPTRWDAAGNATLLGPPPDPARGGSASAVSSDGQTIVGSNLGAAVMWNAVGEMTTLAPLTPVITSHYASDVNEDGSIVVGARNRVLNEHTTTADAFVWTHEIGMRRLVDAVSNDAGLAAAMAGWTLYGADAISANGRYISGWGRDRNNDYQAWMLDRGADPAPFAPISPVPEPELYGALGVFMLGATLVRRLRPSFFRKRV